MKRLIPLLFASVIFAGCGGSGGSDPGKGIITGQVTDTDGQPVRGATVTCDGETTTTSMAGTYHFNTVKGGVIEVKASVRDEGIDYRGRTYATVTAGDQRSNVNITMGAVGNLGTIRGEVRDEDGYLLSNVPVFAYSGVGSSARAYTDDNGEFKIEELVGGYEYEIMATGQGFRSDYTTRTLSSGSSIFVSLALSSPSNPSLTAPKNLDVVTWVSPYSTRASGGASALDWARASALPGRLPRDFRPAASRSLRDDIAVEADLTWDEQRFADHLGWGVYRAKGASGTLSGLEFNADPLSAWFQDVGLTTGSTYRYAVTTLSANYPDYPGQTESSLSSIETAITLERITLNTVADGTLTPTFFAPVGSGAQEYAFYVFDQSPIIGVSEIWRSDITSSNSRTYNGPSLVRGRRYYAFVLGLANSRSSRTISEVEEFTP